MDTQLLQFRSALSSWSLPVLCATLAGGFIIYLVHRIILHPHLFNPFRHIPTAGVRRFIGKTDSRLIMLLQVDYRSSVMDSFNLPTLVGKPIWTW
jgi:hypothetical protein